MSKTTQHAGVRHWQEYLIEASGLGLFMLVASAVGVLLAHPSSPIHRAVPGGLPSRMLAGLAMALTAVVLVYSPWGKRSGAHFNPAFTLAFYRLGKVAPGDAWGYATAQFAGGAAGMFLASLLWGRWLAAPEVHYVATLPGEWGAIGAWLGEFSIAVLLMTVVLNVSNRPRIARYTGVCAAICIFLFITFEGPVSGMSLNPARTLASALAARDWTALWVYFTAPPSGMLTAAWLYTRVRGRSLVGCAKMLHDGPSRCIFCEYQSRAKARSAI